MGFDYAKWIRPQKDKTEHGQGVTVGAATLLDAADEIDRLRAVNAELLAALHCNLNEWRKFALLNVMQQETVDQTRSAIAKATEVTP